ncbi:MAG: glycosyltransferase family 2 protein [Candidatus Omnitrophota bacterium]
MRADKVSICIPAYNKEIVIAETIKSVLFQNYPDKEILVIDDCSTDNTAKVIKKYPVKLIINEKRLGISGTLERLIKEARGKYIFFLCDDDLITNKLVIRDAVKIFQSFPKVGYITRYYYQFMNGYPGAVRVHRSQDPYFQADNPSGLAFRKSALPEKVSGNIFVEAASIVKYVLNNGWEYKIMEYDTIAVRVHPGGNTATVKSYYKDSPTLSWLSVVGKHKLLLTAFISFIQLKNWAGYKYLFREIWLFIKLRPVNLLRPDFWFYALIAIFTPSRILRKLTNWYKHRVSRRFVSILERRE